MKEAKSEQAMLNSLVADYLCTRAPKIGNKFKVWGIFLLLQWGIL